MSGAALTGAFTAGLGNPLVPYVARDHDVPISSAQWTLTLSLLVGVIATPLLSRVADGNLRKQVLLAALAVTAVGCVLSAVTTSFGGLLAGRALQGCGYALVPLTVGIAREWLTGRDLARTLTVLSTSIVVGVGFGNPVVGIWVRVADARAAFAFAAVVAGVAVVAVWRVVPTSHETVPSVGVDLVGAVLLGLGLGLMLLGVSESARVGWSDPLCWGLATAGSAITVVWFGVERRLASPLVDVRLALLDGMWRVNAVAVLLGVGVFGGSGAAIILVQHSGSTGPGLGFSVFASRLASDIGSISRPLASLLAPAITRWITARGNLRSVLPLGAGLVAVAFAGLAAVPGEAWQLGVFFAVMGLGIGVAYAAMPALIVAGAPTDRTASAIGVNQVLRLMGGAVGAAVIGAVLTASAGGLPDPSASGYRVAALLALVCAGGAGLVAWRRVTPSDS